ncbi:MAG: hypothetical protein K0R27_5144, partial [Xanthobacteraceae bacterium]|nr:hypothetical protein [Xanthobacteraceae bacterium]
AVAGAAAGGAVGGLVGALTSEGVPEDRAHVYAEGVRRGGTLVSARVPADREIEAQTILDEEASVDLVDRERVYRAITAPTASATAASEVSRPPIDAGEKCTLCDNFSRKRRHVVPSSND